MKVLLGVLLGLACGVGLWLLIDARELPPPTLPVADRGSEPDHARLAELERAVARLEQELSVQRAPLRTVPPPETTSFVAAPPPPSDGVDPRWYLQQYERSFDGGGDGSEYFRLAVDAYATALLADLCRLVRSPVAPSMLRAKLAAMLGTPRFARNPDAIDALLALLRSAGEDRLGFIAIQSLAAIGDESTGIALERMVWGLGSAEQKQRALGAIVHLGGPDANQALQRLFTSATSTEERSLVIAALSAGDPDAALALFRQASLAEDQVRLHAAGVLNKRFRGDAFRAFVEEWLGYEQDPQVRQALGEAQKRMNEIPPYAAQRAIGPPDAVATEDHPNAWASRQADMGRQWLELGYRPARRAAALRIHEVCVPGAVVEVRLTDEAGQVHVVWTGRDPTTTPGVFEVRFPPTSYRVRSARIVLDTNLRPGWSEIDAVELVGPDGNAWAVEAHASSAYGQ